MIVPGSLQFVKPDYEVSFGEQFEVDSLLGGTYSVEVIGFSELDVTFRALPSWFWEDSELPEWTWKKSELCEKIGYVVPNMPYYREQWAKENPEKYAKLLCSSEPIHKRTRNP